MGEHPTKAKPQGTYLLQSSPLPRSQFSGAVFQKIKECRRVAARYDKLAANYLAFIQLASIKLWLRVNEVYALNRLSKTRAPLKPSDGDASKNWPRRNFHSV